MTVLIIITAHPHYLIGFRVTGNKESNYVDRMVYLQKIVSQYYGGLGLMVVYMLRYLWPCCYFTNLGLDRGGG